MKKILLVEDEYTLSSFLGDKLRKEGFDVEIAEDGEIGLKKMKEYKPNLVLLDIVMPKKGGFEVIEEAKKDEDIKDIPIVIISNSGQPVELDKAKELGVTDWLIKTDFGPQEVLDKVKNNIS